MFTRKDRRNDTASRKIHCLASDCQIKMLTILCRLSPFLTEQRSTSGTILILNFPFPSFGLFICSNGYCLAQFEITAPQANEHLISHRIFIVFPLFVCVICPFFYSLSCLTIFFSRVPIANYA